LFILKQKEDGFCPDLKIFFSRAPNLKFSLSDLYENILIFNLIRILKIFAKFSAALTLLNELSIEPIPSKDILSQQSLI